MFAKVVQNFYRVRFWLFGHDDTGFDNAFVVDKSRANTSGFAQRTYLNVSSQLIYFVLDVSVQAGTFPAF